MSIMHPPKLGPIVGHTTDRSCRLWIRAGCPGETGTGLAEDNCTLGILTVMEIGDTTDASSFKAAQSNSNRAIES